MQIIKTLKCLKYLQSACYYCKSQHSNKSSKCFDVLIPLSGTGWHCHSWLSGHSESSCPAERHHRSSAPGSAGPARHQRVAQGRFPTERRGNSVDQETCEIDHVQCVAAVAFPGKLNKNVSNVAFHWHAILQIANFVSVLLSMYAHRYSCVKHLAKHTISTLQVTLCQRCNKSIEHSFPSNNYHADF